VTSIRVEVTNFHLWHWACTCISD